MALLTVADFKARTYKFSDSFPLSGDAQIENAIAAASDSIERYLQRLLVADTHTQIVYPQYGEYESATEKWLVDADQWPVMEIMTATDPKTNEAITDIDVGLFSFRKGSERIRYLTIEDGAYDPLKIEYAAGYRLPDETSAAVNTRLGTDAALVWDTLPEKIAQSCAALTVYQAQRVASGAVGRRQTSQFIEGQKVVADYGSEFRFENDLLRSLSTFRSLD